MGECGDVDCREAEHDGVAGVLTFVRDNGHGFTPGKTTAGRSLAGMAARAASIHATFACESAPGTGTAISIFLPYVRPLSLP